jgi:hypothetical protein
MAKFWIDEKTGKEMVEIVSDPQTSWVGTVDEMTEDQNRKVRRGLQRFRDEQKEKASSQEEAGSKDGLVSKSLGGPQNLAAEPFQQGDGSPKPLDPDQASPETQARRVAGRRDDEDDPVEKTTRRGKK